jgi:acyl carrier protein
MEEGCVIIAVHYGDDGVFHRVTAHEVEDDKIRYTYDVIDIEFEPVEEEKEFFTEGHHYDSDTLAIIWGLMNAYEKKMYPEEEPEQESE